VEGKWLLKTVMLGEMDEHKEKEDRVEIIYMTLRSDAMRIFIYSTGMHKI